jgi:hypothetical protein
LELVALAALQEQEPVKPERMGQLAEIPPLDRISRRIVGLAA